MVVALMVFGPEVRKAAALHTPRAPSPRHVRFSLVQSQSADGILALSLPVLGEMFTREYSQQDVQVFFECYNQLLSHSGPRDRRP